LEQIGGKPATTKNDMNTTAKMLLSAFGAAALLSLAGNSQAQYKAVGDDGIAASPKLRQFLNERKMAGKKTPGSDRAVKPYPLKTCIVSDEKLGEHGKPYVFTHEGQEFKLCCDDCLPDFKKDSAKYVKKLSEAAKK